MHQFFESAGIALSAIWTNKLRSLLTVLGNIVAVTSIIAVVSLVQGLNSSVKDAIQSGIGVDTFTVSRTGITRTDDEQLRAQSNPRVSLDDAAAIRRASPSVALVMAQANASA
jgi:putative ABC transport system permease protein